MDKKYNQPLHILIDGADKLGKSTVIELLSRKLDLPVIKMPNAREFIDNEMIERISKFYNEILIQFKEYDFIMDRGFTSSIVYSRIFNREFDISYIENIEKILMPKVFIFTAENSKIKDDIQKHNEKWSRINEAFRDLSNFKGYTIIRSDYASPIDLCNEILENL